MRVWITLKCRWVVRPRFGAAEIPNMVKECKLLKWLMTRSCNGTACLQLPMTKIHVFALHKRVVFTDKRNLQSYSIVNNMATLTFGERTVFVGILSVLRGRNVQQWSCGLDIRSRFPTAVIFNSVLQNAQEGPGAHLAYYLVCVPAFFPGDKMIEIWSWLLTAGYCQS